MKSCNMCVCSFLFSLEAMVFVSFVKRLVIVQVCISNQMRIMCSSTSYHHACLPINVVIISKYSIPKKREVQLRKPKFEKVKILTTRLLKQSTIEFSTINSIGLKRLPRIGGVAICYPICNYEAMCLQGIIHVPKVNLRTVLKVLCSLHQMKEVSQRFPTFS